MRLFKRAGLADLTATELRGVGFAEGARRHVSEECFGLFDDPVVIDSAYRRQDQLIGAVMFVHEGREIGFCKARDIG